LIVLFSKSEKVKSGAITFSASCLLFTSLLIFF
jgi:hypothetical protein